MTDLPENHKIAIVGPGLIGGSIARGLAAQGKNLEIVAVGRNESVLAQARAEGVISAYSTDIAEGCRDANLVIIAVPSLTVESVLLALKPVVTPDMVITDAASVKGAVVDAIERVFGHLPPNVVPGHPIAGSEHSGYGASSTELYRGKKVILTPLPDTDPGALDAVKALWQSLGAEVLTMTVEHHDAVLAATSHLPHLLAYALVDTLSQQGESEEIFRYAAGGFRDFTRIASSDPQMWHDIFMANGKATVAVLDQYIDDLHRLRQAILDKDSAELMTTFSRAKKSRDNFLQQLTCAGKPTPEDKD